MIDKKVLLLLGVMGGAAIFAVARTHEPTPPDITPAAADPAPMPVDSTALPPGHPPTGDLPPGHPPIASNAPTAAMPPKSDASIAWTAPARWEAVPHASTMRIVTYRVPKVAGDIEDAEVSVTRAGGDIEQNAARWVSQFDEKGRVAKRTTKQVAGLTVYLVDVEGNYTSMKGEVEKDWAMFGAIVDTPNGSHFFKMTGPKKSVANARGEMDALIVSIKTK
jgi:hypothetical protein